MKRFLTGFFILILFVVAPIAAGAGPQDGSGAANSDANVEADPIRCWWRTSTSAVRVGEPFSLVLTCAVVENLTATVVPDQSRLDPSSMQLPPFEVIGGQRNPDLHSDQRRFFQYQYRLRLISEDLFGKDARIPSVQISYYVQSKVGRGEAVRGRDRNYILPVESIRVLSLVPNDASDIRDAPSWTFNDIDAQRFRARVFFVAAGVLFTAGALVLLVSLIRMVRQYRAVGTVARRLLSDGAILRSVGREITIVRREAEGQGWTHELVGRGLAALRIAGTFAMSRRVGQIRAGTKTEPHEGQVLVRGGWLWGKKILVSGAATAETIARELSSPVTARGRRRSLEVLQTAVASFTAAQFGRDEKLDDTGLAQSLGAAAVVVRRLRFEHLWLVKKINNATEFAVELGNRAWSR
ncbi:MAG: hypothetical protein C5B57_08555 [Blastocatellia bacterium]|nr:MAG: hypothetical protein C5B57_08555 [Blastocatellia bacterium]